MNSRERVWRALERKQPDRVPIQDTPWEATTTLWHKQGLPDDVTPAEYFGYEIVSIGADLSPRFPVKVLSRDEEYIVTSTPEGGVRRNHRDYSTTPEIIDYPIKKKEDWDRIKKRLKPDYTRIDWVSARSTYNKAKQEGKFIVFSGGTGYDLLQSYIKSEELLVTMLQEPDWIREMFRVHAELLMDTARRMLRKGLRFDGAWIYNDMGYKNTSLFSPKTYCDLLLETDKVLCDFFHKHNMKVILHSCGNVSVLIPHLIEAGFDCLQPLEVKAGMDVVELKKEYGDRLAFMGGVDVCKMEMDETGPIEEEIRTKIELAKVGGGYLYHSDHSIPKDVSFERYKFVIDLVRRCGKYGP